MKTLIVLLLLTPALSIAKIYNGTLVDAHSQVGPLISNEQVSKQIINNDVDLTLLSIRGKWDLATQRYLSIQKLTNQKTKYLIPTKLGFIDKASVNSLSECTSTKKSKSSS